MEKVSLVLNKNKGFNSVNQIQNLNVNLTREEKLLPANELTDTVDAYEQYLDEKDACNKYRLIFTIRPFCTNILCNHITEGVYEEGSDKCRMVLRESDIYNITESGKQTIGHCVYKMGNSYDPENPSSEVSDLKKSPITRDTGYSCPDYKINKTGSTNYNYLNYYCGLDIFNNHLLRRKEFVIINQKKSEDTGDSKYFNTIFDYVRDPFGNFQKGIPDGSGNNPNIRLHIYNKSNIYTFQEALNNKLIEENGWIGFKNCSILATSVPDTYAIYDSELASGSTSTGTISRLNSRSLSISSNNQTPVRPVIPSVLKIQKAGGTINRVINNKNAGTFVDLYPTREHFSFVPHYNEKRKRLEKNWEYCLTYPYENVFDDFTVSETISNRQQGTKTITGLICEIEDGANFPIFMLFEDEPSTLQLLTNTRHSLKPGDLIKMSVIYYDYAYDECWKYHEIIGDIRVSNIGKNGYDLEHYFSIEFDDISSDLSLLLSGITFDGQNAYFRYEKISHEKPCKYYLRKFKKIDTCLNSDINKLGFSKTIYGDDIAQIVYNSDVDITDLRDNLGRELSVIYLTIIKTNNGYNEWYNQAYYGSSKVEFSHCFGKVTSGFDLPTWTNKLEHNVHMLHNLTSIWNIIKSTPLEDGLSINLDTFYGDLVELDEFNLVETVLEDVKHRVNTAQRECTHSKFRELLVDNIVTDDYETGYNFTHTTTNIMCNNAWGNLDREGYYYQAHYPIKLREYSTVVNEGYHTLVKCTLDTVEDAKSRIIINTNVNYYFTSGDEIWLWNNETNEKYVCHVENVIGDDFTMVSFITPSELDLTNFNFDDYSIFKPNRIKPSTAYELNDGSGRYIWRDLIPSSKLFRTSDIYDSIFTNGSIYIHKNINFYMKRQDPFGDYGLQLPRGTCPDGLGYGDLQFYGNEEDVSYGDYFENNENNIC